jgi:hypothetical protein
MKTLCITMALFGVCAGFWATVGFIVYEAFI